MQPFTFITLLQKTAIPTNGILFHGRVKQKYFYHKTFFYTMRG